MVLEIFQNADRRQTILVPCADKEMCPATGTKGQKMERRKTAPSGDQNRRDGFIRHREPISKRPEQGERLADLLRVSSAVPLPATRYSISMDDLEGMEDMPKGRARRGSMFSDTLSITNWPGTCGTAASGALSTRR